MGEANASQGKKKNWEEIVKDLSSGEDSDAHDEPNVVALEKNAQNIVDLLSHTFPTLRHEPTYNRNARFPTRTTDRELERLREGLFSSAAGALQNARPSPGPPGEEGGDEAIPTVPPPSLPMQPVEEPRPSGPEQEP